jgi:FkbM family methyltransferase
MVWHNILKTVAGVGLRMQMGLFFSAFVDFLLAVASSRVSVLPRCYLAGLVYLKPYRVFFYIRALSDDLYSVMPKREWDVNEKILSSLRKGDLFIDVGANVGYYSVIAGKIVGESGQVISVEPVPSTARVLDINLKLNGLKNVVVVPKAAWNIDCLLDLQVPRGFFGLSSVHESQGTFNKVNVEGFPLDDLSDVGNVRLLKIDAEGSEYMVLEGATRLLERTEFVVLEASDQKDEIIRLLLEKGFKLRKMKFTTYIFAQRNV